MHPSKDIVCARGDELSGRRIALCITGSVAAVKCPELARELMRHGAEVRTVMSRSASELISPRLMHWATGEEVVTELTGRIEHVDLAQWADLVLVAPATANTLSKIANAIDDTPVTSVVSVAFGLGKPVVLVPAMHASMYRHKLLQENLEKLRKAGAHVLRPKLEEGKAKILPPDEILDFIIAILRPKDLKGRRVLVTAGPTVEPLDPVKIITNRSSGKMGIAVARAAAARGAEVVLVYGPGTEIPPPNVRTVRVERTAEMREAVIEELKRGCDIVIGAAAPQDFVVENTFGEKLRHSQAVEIKLVPAPRVLDGVRELVPNAFIVGFKAEVGVSDEKLVEVAKEKMKEGQFDMVVANDVGRPGAGFGVETNEVIILTPFGSKKVKASKMEIANIILDAAVDKLRGQGQ
ncbi:MAG: bifunctional phosphopantothenoylcysteine decarboxylase/phosphopantothenate--cysteine ligase CoaBC [Hadesarchaea archaeon]|nr:bifunctional phosphopantothenoylcysteine decarboxylase/phosphopantothenate--cysteine ligase CoaBC [Hadesarchaea archaeon]